MNTPSKPCRQMAAEDLALAGRPTSGRRTCARWAEAGFPAQLLADLALKAYQMEAYRGTVDLLVASGTWRGPPANRRLDRST